MENKKYEFTDETTSIGTKTLHRIRALRNFGDVKKGDLGGFIESEKNLSHKGLAWVYDNAQVDSDALVFGCAQIRGTARVCGRASVCDFAWIDDDVLIGDDAVIYSDAQVRGTAWVYGSAKVGTDAWVYGNARIYGNVRVYNNAMVDDNIQICGRASVGGNARIDGGARIRNSNDCLAIDNIGSRHDTTTFFKTSTDEIYVKCGCFYGSIDEFLSKVETTHGTNKYGNEYRLACKLAELHIHGNNN